MSDLHEKAEILRNLGDVAQSRENVAMAEEHFGEAVVLLRDNELTGDAFDGFTDLIDVSEQCGAELRAIEWCEKAITFTVQTDHESGFRHVDRNW